MVNLAEWVAAFKEARREEDRQRLARFLSGSQVVQVAAPRDQDSVAAGGGGSKAMENLAEVIAASKEEERQKFRRFLSGSQVVQVAAPRDQEQQWCSAGRVESTVLNNSPSERSYRDTIEEDFQVFISHRGGDTSYKTDFARPLHERLEQEHIKAFLDEADLGIGCMPSTRMLTALRNCKVIVLYLDQHYFWESRYCVEELDIAISRLKNHDDPCQVLTVTDSCPLDAGARGKWEYIVERCTCISKRGYTYAHVVEQMVAILSDAFRTAFESPLDIKESADKLIQNKPQLFQSSIHRDPGGCASKNHTVFVSLRGSVSDALVDFGRELRRLLKDQQVHVYVDSYDLQPGLSADGQMNHVINTSRVVVLYIDRIEFWKSRYCVAELDRAIARHRDENDDAILFPVMNSMAVPKKEQYLERHEYITSNCTCLVKDHRQFGEIVKQAAVIISDAFSQGGYLNGRSRPMLSQRLAERRIENERIDRLVEQRTKHLEFEIERLKEELRIANARART